MRKIMDVADHDNVYICWNSNSLDVKEGSIANVFALMVDYIGMVHITELWKEEYGEYPYRELFNLL